MLKFFYIETRHTHVFVVKFKLAKYTNKNGLHMYILNSNENVLHMYILNSTPKFAYSVPKKDRWFTFYNCLVILSMH